METGLPGRRPLLDPVTRAMVQLGVVLLVIGALKLSASVTLPLAFAIFLMALFWPLYRAVERVGPRWLAALAALLGFLVVIGVLGGALWFAGQQVAERIPEHQASWDRLSRQIDAWLTSHGLPTPGGSRGLSYQTLSDELKTAGKTVVESVGGFVLVTAFLVLGLIEVHDFRAKVGGQRDTDEKGFRDVVARVARDFQRYILVRTAVGLITGVLVGLGTWAIGLDLPFVWGLSNFLLNYIPTIGSILGVIPPTVFGLTQSPGMALATFAVVGGVQMIMGAYVDPLLQGHYLRLSALVVLLAVTFWGWVWGPAGAFIGVPMTIVVVLVAREFERSRWLADLLAARSEVEARRSG